MSRVQCLECGSAVVVDPTGVCPEGHVVGSAGVRVAGAMGNDAPHPDEPEPWVATVVLDEVDASPIVRERTIRPVQVAGATAAEAERGEAADHESMLRELHALGDIHDPAPPSAVPQAAATPPAEAPPVAHVPAPPSEQVAEGFAELSALEAAFQALGYEDDATPGGDQPDAPTSDEAPVPPPAPAPDPATREGAETAPTDDLADVEGLFASPTAAPTPDTPDTPDGQAPAAHGPEDVVTPPPPPPPSSAPSSAPGPDPDRDQVPAYAAAAPASAPDVPDAPRADPTDPAPPSADAPEEPVPADPPEAPRARDTSLDITNFTARGGKVGAGRGGRRKRFGR